MGSIRTLLAVSVIWIHTDGIIFVGGRMAVQIFFLISGFMMSYVLVECKYYVTVSQFYLSRVLRLFPIYWFVTLITLALMCIVGIVINKFPPVIQVYRNIEWRGFVTLTLTNIFLLGQDWILFTGVKNGIFQLVLDCKKSEILVWMGLILPQAWSLGIEVSFYLIAPFVLRRRKAILCLLAASLAIRACLLMSDFGSSNSWVYQFFPAELSLFLLGALSHQVLKPIYFRVLGASIEQVSWGVMVAVLIYCIVFCLLPYQSANKILLIAVFVAALPFLFVFQINTPLDRKIGALSYPIYICHMTIAKIVLMTLKVVYVGKYFSVIHGIVSVALSILVAYVLDRFVGEKFDAIRSKIKAGKPVGSLMRKETQGYIPP